MKKPWFIIGGLAAVAVLAWLAFGFFGVQALFTDRVVDEELPEFIQVHTQPSVQSAEANQVGPRGHMLGQGSFQQGDSTYTISGKAFLSEIDGKLNLSFVDFQVTNGPDLFVYAVQTNSTDNKTVKDTVGNGGFINLGVLKGNIGNQNYILEGNFDPNQYQVIAIWCQRFSRNFGAVDLSKITIGGGQ